MEERCLEGVQGEMLRRRIRLDIRAHPRAAQILGGFGHF